MVRPVAGSPLTRAHTRDGRTGDELMMRRVLAGLALAAAFGASGIAHHSFGAVYLESDNIEVDGNIVEFQYKNPHSWVHVRGSERGGLDEEHVYSAEWVSTSQLETEGITKTTLKPGDKVRIWGAPSKNPSEYRMHLKRMERSDGWQWRGRQGQTR
jgi:hypothetical protein